jgi:hypothetical protein
MKNYFIRSYFIFHTLIFLISYFILPKMASESWHVAMYKATQQFENKQFIKSFEWLQEALLLWQDADLDASTARMDNEEYNSWCDLVDILTLVGGWAAIEMSAHFARVLDNLTAAIARFELPETCFHAEWQALTAAANEDLYWLLEGLRLTAIYCERQEIPLDGDEKILSFELLPDSKIKCYGWTDTPEEGSAEAEEEAATIAYLQQDFNSFFIAPYLDTDMSAAELGKALLEKQDYTGALAQLQLACREEPQAQKELFLLMYEAHFALGELRQAADVLMKAYLLGLHKSQIRKQITTIAQLMLAKPEISADKNERERWQRLFEDFC